MRKLAVATVLSLVVAATGQAAGIVVDPTMNLETSENASAANHTATFTVVLTSEPTADVTIGLSSDDTTEGVVLPTDPLILTFTNGNWDTRQTVTITGVDDFIDDGDVVYQIITSQTGSADPTYQGLDVLDVSVTNIDDDAPPPTVTAVSPAEMVEGDAAILIVTGDGFDPGATVYTSPDGAAWTPAASTVYFSAQTLRFTAPSLAPGTYWVRVTNPDSAFSELADVLTVLTRPEMVSVVPDCGPKVGGTTVTITGSGFDPTTQVTIGYFTEKDLGSQVIVSANQITGTMPPCDRTDLAGNIAGFPTTVETRTFKVEATDVSGTVSRWFTIEVRDMTITPTTLPLGETGWDYYVLLGVTGGTAPHTWSVTTGALPPGLTLDTSSGSIYGVPRTEGSYDFTVQVTDSTTPTALTATQGYTIDIYRAPTSTQGYVRWEAWTQSFADFTALEAAFAGIPDARKFFLTFNGPIDWDSLGDIAFGVRMSAVIEAPQDGGYVFSIASGGPSELYISTDADPANLGATPIASIAGSTGHMEWNAGGEPNQDSAAIPLVAGQKYYIEARYIALAGSDHLAVAWMLPDATFEEPLWASRAVVPGVVLHYTFDEAPGAATAVDSSANGFNGTNTGVTAGVAGQVGTAYEFDGSSSTVEVPNLGLTFTEATFTVWLNIAEIQQENDSVIHTDDWSGGSLQFQFRDSGSVDFAVNGGGEPDAATPFTASDIGNWVHIAATYDSTANPPTAHYRNGSPDGTGGTTGRTLDFTSGSDIGSWNGGRWFKGRMDDFRIYDRALSEAEINNIIAGTDIDTTAPMEVPDPSPVIVKRPVAADRVELTGTVTATQGTDAVSGTGALFLSEVFPGDFIRVEGTFSGQWAEAAAVTANNALTLLKVYAGATDSGAGFAAPSLQRARVGTSYDVALLAAGGTRPYAWAVTGGTMAPGITLDPNGWLSGTPTLPGTHTFTVQVTDSAPGIPLVSWPREFTLHVDTAGPTIATEELPPATRGLPYETSIQAIGGGGEVAFSIILGQLPDGLHLNAVMEPFNFWIDVDGTPTRLGPEWGFTYVEGPAVAIAPFSDLQTAEAGLGTATFEVALQTAPTSDVTLSLSSSNMSEGTIDGATGNVLVLTFTSANWATDQTVTVTGVDDVADDGNVGYLIVTSQTASADAAYQGLEVADVSVTNIDDDTAGVTVVPTSGLITNEDAGAADHTATFTVMLASEPTADVTVAVSSSDTSEGTIDGADAFGVLTLTFSALDWDLARTVTVTGVDEVDEDGNIVYTVDCTSASADPLYNSLLRNVPVTNLDDDTAFTVTISLSAVTEGDGTLAIGTVSVPIAPTSDLTVTLACDDTTEATVPAQVTIPAGLTSVDFDVTILDDTQIDGDQTVTISASAPMCLPGSDSMLVNDNETQTITVTLPASATEGEGVLVDQGTVTIPGTWTTNLVIDLASSDASELGVPATVTVLQGDTSATFNLTVIDDGEIDGTQNVTVTPTLAGWTCTADSMDVLDNEAQTITLTLPASATEGEGVLVDQGTVTIPGTWTTNLVIDLASSDASELGVPATVTVLQGDTSATFDITVGNDSSYDGTQTAAVTASAAGWAPGSAVIDILDNDPPPPPPDDDGCAPGAGSPAGLLCIAAAVTLMLRRRKRGT